MTVNAEDRKGSWVGYLLEQGVLEQGYSPFREPLRACEPLTPAMDQEHPAASQHTGGGGP